MSKQNMIIFIAFFAISALVVYLYFNSLSYFLSYFIGGISTCFIIFSSFYSYQKSILQNASEYKIKTNKKNKKPKNKQKNSIALNDNTSKKELDVKNKKKTKKTKKKLDKKQDKLQKQFNQTSINIKMFLFLPKILGYVILCYGYIYLSDNHLMNIYAFLIGISVLPLFAFIIKSIENK